MSREELCKEYGITEGMIKERIEKNSKEFSKGNCVRKKYWRGIAIQELLNEFAKQKLSEGEKGE